MAGENTFHRWKVSPGELDDMTPTKARDLIVRCFFEAQKETFARAQSHLGQAPDDAALMATPAAR